MRGWIRAGVRAPVLADDLDITLGEAAANAVEHAYAATGQPGEFTYRITHRDDGALDVRSVTLAGGAPNPPTTITADAAWSSSTSSPPISPSTPAPTVPTSSSGSRPSTLHRRHRSRRPGHTTGARRPGDLLATQRRAAPNCATSLCEDLLEALTGAGPATLDLRQIHYLSSAGIGLLIAAAQHAADHHIRVKHVRRHAD